MKGNAAAKKKAIGLSKKHDDEETGRILESELQALNNQKIDVLADQVDQMRNLSRHLGGQIQEQEPMVSNL